jgi:chemotaxis protein histidine kinase CheA
LISAEVPLRRHVSPPPTIVVTSPAMTPTDPPATAPALSFQERFAALEREWKQQLPGKLRDAAQRMQACRAVPGDRPALEGLHRVLHTLAGSAGTFGLAGLGTDARAIEKELDRVMALPAPASADLDAADAALQALVATAPGG